MVSEMGFEPTPPIGFQPTPPILSTTTLIQNTTKLHKPYDYSKQAFQAVN